MSKHKNKRNERKQLQRTHTTTPNTDISLTPEVLDELTNEQMELARNIQNKLRKTAQTIIEIGNDLKTATQDMKKEVKELFFEEVGMSKRSAQRYMQIATHEKIKALTSTEIEGKTMTDLMQLMVEPTQTKDITFDAVKVANGFYARYKNKPNELEEIIVQLQQLLTQSKSNDL